MTDNNDDLKMLWGAQPTAAAPEVYVLMARATKVKNKLRNKLIRGNVILVLTGIFIAWVWIHYQPQMITTKVGIVLCISAIATYVISSTSSLQFLFKSNPEADSANYLVQLIVLRQKQEYLQRTIMALYFILLSVGICLYMIEYAMMMGLRGGLIAYGVTLAWIAFNWFYTRPRTARKQLASINEAISQLEEVNRQLKE